jgi:hypothetical protein
MVLTCVSAYFPVKSKHQNNVYLNWFENTLSINCPYIFFTTKSEVELIKFFRKGLPTYFVECEIEDFYAYKYKDRMTTHDSHCPSVELNLIWNEKIFMVQKASEINPFNSVWFHWIDAGTCAYRDVNPTDKEFPNKNFLETLPKDKFIFSSSLGYIESRINATDYYHYVAATAFLLHKTFIDKYVETYKDYMEKLIDKNNIWSEQVIFTHIFKDRPELYFKLCDGYGEVTKLLY